MRILRVAADLSSIEMEGEPLENLGLENAVFVDRETGEIVGKLTGFAVYPGQTVSEALKAQIPPGCDLLIRPRTLH